MNNDNIFSTIWFFKTLPVVKFGDEVEISLNMRSLTKLIDYRIIKGFNNLMSGKTIIQSSGTSDSLK